MKQQLIRKQDAYDRLNHHETDDVGAYPVAFDLSMSAHQQQQLQNPAGPRPHMTVVLQTLRGPRKHADYPSRISRSLGEMQIGVGIVSAILNGIGLFLQLNRNNMNVSFYVVCGIWGVLFFSLSGAFAIMAGKRKTTCPIIAHMVLAIFASVTAFILIGQGAGGIAFEVVTAKDTTHLNKYDTSEEHNLVMASIVISVGLLVCGLLEMVVCIWGCSLCCKILCMEPLTGSTRGSDQPMIVVSGQGQDILNANSYLTDLSEVDPGTLPPPYSDQAHNL